MKKLISANLILLFLASAALASSVVDITEIGVGARPLGMGKAFNSIADDGSAIFTNPAGLTRVKKFDLMSMSGNLIGEVPYMSLGGAWRNDLGVWGLGYVGASVSEIREAVLVGITPEVTGNQASFANSTLVLSYANDAKNITYLNSLEFLENRDVQVGVNLKMASQGFSGGASFEGGNASGFELDLGTMWTVNDGLTGSILIKNLMPGNNLGPDELAVGIAGGLAYDMPKENLVTAVDAEITNGFLLMHLGAEWKPMPRIALRGGLDQAANGFNLAIGVGTNVNGFTFDYAYHTYAELSDFTTHYFSVGFVSQ